MPLLSRLRMLTAPKPKSTIPMSLVDQPLTPTSLEMLWKPTPCFPSSSLVLITIFSARRTLNNSEKLTIVNSTKCITLEQETLQVMSLWLHHPKEVTLRLVLLSLKSNASNTTSTTSVFTEVECHRKEEDQLEVKLWAALVSSISLRFTTN